MPVLGAILRNSGPAHIHVALIVDVSLYAGHTKLTLIQLLFTLEKNRRDRTVNLNESD